LAIGPHAHPALEEKRRWQRDAALEQHRQRGLFRRQVERQYRAGQNRGAEADEKRRAARRRMAHFLTRGFEVPTHHTLRQLERELGYSSSTRRV
jgi:hypothetical protein